MFVSIGARAGSRLAAALVVVLGAGAALAADIPVNFDEYGKTVNGFQDQFGGSALATGWTVIGSSIASVSGGYLHLVSASNTNDPTKVLYQGAPYDGITQNVLLLVKVNSASTSDCRMGATASNTAAGLGVNAMFRGADSFSNVAFLDDFVAHGTQNAFTWSHGTSYWIRFLHSPNKPAGTDPLFNGLNDCFAKVWRADGTTPEPVNYMFTWASNDARSGYAGIQSTIYSGSANWDVGYVLIQANGLPSISPGPPAPLTPPNAPTDLVADYKLGSGAVLTWTDNSKDELGFEVERQPVGFAYSLLTTTGVDGTQYVDASLYPSTTYRYRVRSYNATGKSAYTNEVEITTEANEVAPSVPDAPSPLVATPLGLGSIALSWTDRSADETRFDLVRAEGGESFKSLAVLQPDVVGFADYSLHPGWPYTYRVRALSLQGPSAYTNNAGSAAPATLALTVRPAAMTDSPKVGKDKVSFTIAYVQSPPREGFAVDPVRAGVRLQLGSTNAPVVVNIVEGDKTWKVKKTKAAWKSPKGALPKVSLSVDTAKGLMTVSVSGFSFTNVPGMNSRTLFAVGLDGGIAVGPWTSTKPGVYSIK